MQRRFIIIVMLALTATGCDSKAGKVKTYQVGGQIYYDGKPAAGMMVYLFPTAAPGVPDIPANPHGETDADGRFSIMTYSEADGAAEGSYQLVLYWPEVLDGKEEENRDRLLGWYSVARSRLTLQVKQDTNNVPTIQLPLIKSPPADSSGGIPGRN